MNILFGQPEDERRYAAVVECCELAPDFAELVGRDNTEVGAQGHELSNSIKAR